MNQPKKRIQLLKEHRVNTTLFRAGRIIEHPAGSADWLIKIGKAVELDESGKPFKRPTHRGTRRRRISENVSPRPPIE